MFLKKSAQVGLILILTLLSLTACGAPSGAPANTNGSTATPTIIVMPTDTPEPPTDTPAATTAAPTQSADTTSVAPTATVGADTTAVATAAPTTATAGQPTGGAASGGSQAQDKYQYLGQSMVDNTQILPNRQVTVTWTIKNAGTNAWTKDYVMRYFSGPQPDKTTYTFGKDVPPDQTLNLTVTFTTPADLGNYDLWFKLTNSQGQNFGDLDFAFTVTNSPQKATPTTAK